MPPPQVNARITRIAGAGSGSSNSWDSPETPGSEKWAGEIEGYYQERRDRVTEQGSQDRTMTRSLIFANDDLDVELTEGDAIEFEVSGVAKSGSIKLIERRDLPGMPADVRTTRLTLVDV